MTPVLDAYDSVSKLRFAVPQFADDVAKTRSAGSWPPLGAVTRICIMPAPPAVLEDSSQVYVPEKSIGKFVLVPEATEAVDVTVIEREYEYPEACAGVDKKTLANKKT